MSANPNILPRVLPIEQASQELRERMMRDASHAWNSLVALARYGFTEEIKLAASLAVLAHTVGPPTARAKIDVNNGGKPRLQSLPTLPELTVEEARAIKVLAEARRARSGGEED